MVQICKCQICVQSTLHDIVQICKCQVILVSPSVHQSVSHSGQSGHSGQSVSQSVILVSPSVSVSHSGQSVILVILVYFLCIDVV
jgi:hypothetical protein